MRLLHVLSAGLTVFLITLSVGSCSNNTAVPDVMSELPRETLAGIKAPLITPEKTVQSLLCADIAELILDEPSVTVRLDWWAFESVEYRNQGYTIQIFIDDQAQGEALVYPSNAVLDLDEGVHGLRLQLNYPNGDPVTEPEGSCHVDIFAKKRCRNDSECVDSEVCTDDYCVEGLCFHENNTAVLNSNCYTGPAQTEEIGLCQNGFEYCVDGELSGVCEGEIKPTPEICNGLDDDCDGLIDEGVKHTFYRDLDGDGHGDPKNPKKACKPPPGYVAGGDDCMDSGTVKNTNSYWGTYVAAKDVNPGAVEKCNGVDDNCSAGPSGGALTPSGIDESFGDKGNACNSSDGASCNDSTRVCNEAGTGTMCLSYLTWGSRMFGWNNAKMYDISGYANHGKSNYALTGISSQQPTLKIPVAGGTTDYDSVSKFNGSNQWGIEYYTSGDPHHEISGAQMTMASWVRWDGTGTGHESILGKEYGYLMWLNGGVPGCHFFLQDSTGGSYYGGGWTAPSSYKLTPNKWHHVACTYSKASCKLSIYKDGVLVGWNDKYGNCGSATDMTTGKLLKSNWHLRVGYRYYSGQQWFGGNLASIGIYDVALTQAQIQVLANPDGSGYLPNQANYEFCDNLDNDCDGQTDELNSNKGSSCSGGSGTCLNSGSMICDLNNTAHNPSDEKLYNTVCTVTGQSNGTNCNDGVACTHSDTCSGGTLSSCTGTAYSCTGACRSCNGSGGCNLAGSKCYISSSGCNPSVSSCAGTCYNTSEDSAGSKNSTNSGNTSCEYCNPSSSTNSWSNRPSNWTCHVSYCAGVGTWNKADLCNGSGTCSDKGQNACNDNNVCTNDTCADATGCKNINNGHAEACYTGAPGTLDVGICHAGTQTCSGGGFGSCVGQVTQGTESCNSKDDDCDGTVDEENATGCSTFYKDADGDTYGVNGDTKCLCAGSYPYTATKGGDCDDSNKNAYPGNTEKCNNFDDNCNSVNNEDGAQGCTTYYKDNDNDGYGQSADSQCKCAASDPYDTTLNADCNDGNGAIYPNAKEWCNGVDDDCQGGIDEDFDVGAACSKGVGQCQKSGTKICNTTLSATKCNVTGKGAGTICYDTNNCTHGDVCSGGDNSSCSGTPYSCDDSKSCTSNVCVDDRSQLCKYPVITGQCLIGGNCYNNGQKNASTGNGACQYCNSASIKTQWTSAPSSWQCRPSKCSGLTFSNADYCGNGNGVCQDYGTVNCNKSNKCKNYGCTTSGCNDSNKGNGTKCGGEFCSGDTWYNKDQCQSGTCKDYGTVNCNNNDSTCTNGYCAAGCQISNYASGTKCGGENCSGTTYNKKDTCNGTGSCSDGGIQNCSALSNSCRAGKCKNSGCWIDNYLVSQTCASGFSSQCNGNTWHLQDYCNGLGDCADKGSQNCDSSDSTCRDWYCSGGCTYTDKNTSTVCVGASCANSCTKKEITHCNGSGSCSNGGGQTSCGGNRCSGSSCTSACTKNGQCCDTNGDNRTCIGSVCNDRQPCGGTCDNSDHPDCGGGTCIDCSNTKCESHVSGWHCYNTYGNHSVCGCSSYDNYNNCTGYHACWYC